MNDSQVVPEVHPTQNAVFPAQPTGDFPNKQAGESHQQVHYNAGGFPQGPVQDTGGFPQQMPGPPHQTGEFPHQGFPQSGEFPPQAAVAHHNVQQAPVSPPFSHTPEQLGGE